MPRRQERCLLAVLLLDAGRPIPVDRLVELIWPEHEPADARGILRAYVSRLRRALRETAPDDHSAILGRSGTYTLDVDPQQVDAFRFRDLLARAQSEATPSQRAQMLREALALWHGPALADVGPSSLRDRLTARLDQDRHRALQLRVDADLADGRHGDLIGELTELVTESPLDENLTGQLMLSLYRAGRRSDSLVAFRDLRQRLHDNLGLEPGPQVQGLHSAILRDAPPRLEPVSPPSPQDGGVDVPIPRFLPRPIADFVGRDQILTRLRAEATEDTRSAPLVYAVDGMAGVGKTALAVNLAHLVAEHFPDGQLSIDLRAHGTTTPVDPATALTMLLGQLGVTVTAESLELRALMWRTQTAARRLIVLLDDAVGNEQVLPLLPTGRGSLTLITSRRRLAGIDGVTSVPLAPLPEEEAVALLSRVVGPRSTAHQAETTAVARHCGFLPLAVRLAAARMVNRPSWTMADLVQRISNGQAALRETAGEGRTVAAAFTLSYQHLADESQRLFRLLAIHPGADIDDYAAAHLAGAGLDRVRELLDDLVDNHLLEEPSARRYRMHDLVREYARHLVSDTVSASEREAAATRMVHYYFHAAAHRGGFFYYETLAFDYCSPEPPAPLPPTGDVAQVSAWFEAERGNLVVAVGLAEKVGLHYDAWKLAQAVWRFLFTHRYTADLVATQEISLRCAEALGDDYAAAVACNYLASAEYRRGNWPRACELLTAAAGRIARTATRDLEGGILNNAAAMHTLLGHYREALKMAERSADIGELVGNPRTVVVSCVRASGALARLGRHDEALRQSTRAAELIDEHGLDRLRPEACLAVGVARLAAGRLDEAEQWLRESITLLHREMSDAHSVEAINMRAILQRRRGNLDDAIRLHRESLDLSRDGGSSADDACVGHNAFAVTLHEAGDDSSAREQHMLALTLAEQLHYSYEEASAHAGLGEILAATDQAAATFHWRRAHSIFSTLDVPEQHLLAERLRASGAEPSAPLEAAPGKRLSSNREASRKRPVFDPADPRDRVLGAHPKDSGMPA